MIVSSKKNLPSKPETPSDYSAFLRGIALVGLGLQDCRAKIDRGAYFKVLDKGSSERRITTNYKLLDSHKDYFTVTASFALTIGHTQSKPSQVLSIECTYEAHFHCDDCDAHRDFAQRFADSELRLVMWPYFRQFANDITGRMTIPPILIPFSAGQSPPGR
jgi:hypothetical protein